MFKQETASVEKKIKISVDPLAEQTMDAYDYCCQNPTRFVDSTGINLVGAILSYS